MIIYIIKDIFKFISDYIKTTRYKDFKLEFFEMQQLTKV